MDFYEVDMARKLTVTVPLVTTGVCKGVEAGGILQIIRRELEVNCLPTDIPEHITVDITDLEIGDSVHVNEIHLDGDLEIPFDANFTVLTIVAPKAVEETRAAEGEEAAEAAEAETEE
jgi:large subunit ribosomal protein L25